MSLPRYVQARRLASGETAFYWCPPTRDKARAKRLGMAWPFQSVRLGLVSEMTGRDLAEAADAYTARLEDWRAGLRGPQAPKSLGQYGSLRWLTETYLRSAAFEERVGRVARPDYRRIFAFINGLPTKDGRTVGDLPVKSISPLAANKLYVQFIEGGKLRRGEKCVSYLKTAVTVIGRLHPDIMPRDQMSRAAVNPWVDLTVKRRTKRVKPAVDRQTVYAFAEAAIAAGRPEMAAAAVICFEWAMRPQRLVEDGIITWADYDPPAHRGWVRIAHAKTGAVSWHPLAMEDPETGDLIRTYPEAEAVLARVPRRGVSIVLDQDGRHYTATRFANIVRRIALDAGLGPFSLDACRHGGLTEFEEAGLTTNEGRSLSGHKSTASYEGYAKQTQERALGPTLKRLQHRRRMVTKQKIG